jgi:hypothetical protein
MSAARGILLVLLLTALPFMEADASLGDPASSVATDQARMRASRKVTASAAYSMHEITVPSGTRIREFVSSATGRVFALTWQGPYMPDLKQLLGDRFDAFVQGARSGGASRSSALVSQPGLVVHSSGHMRAFSGKAYLPDQVPAGVRIEDIH